MPDTYNREWPLPPLLGVDGAGLIEHPIGQLTWQVGAGPDLSGVIHRDGSVAWTADQPLGNNKLTGLKDPTTAQDAVNLRGLRLGNVIVVDGKFGSDVTGVRESWVLRFQTIQAALAVAVAGDVVLIAPNTYSGAIVMPSFVTLQGLGIRDKVVLSGAVSWTPIAVGSEAVGFEDIDFGSTFTVNTTGKPGIVIAACRIDSCRFTGGGGGTISYTGRGNATDNFQLVSSFYNTIPLITNDVSVNIDGGLGQFSSIIAGGSVDGVYFQLSDLEVAFGQVHGTIACSFGVVEVHRGGVFTSFTTSASGQINAWATSVGNVIVGAGTTIIINGYPVTGTCTVNGSLELHDSSAVDINVSATGFVTSQDSYIAGTVTVTAGGQFYAWDRFVSMLVNAGFAQILGCSTGDVSSVGGGNTVCQNSNLNGLTSIDSTSTLQVHDSVLQNVNIDGQLFSFSSDFQGTTTSTGGIGGAYVIIHDGRLNNVVAGGDTFRVLGKCPVDGTLTSNSSFDGVGADMRGTTLAGAGTIDRDVLFFGITGSAVGANTIAFNHPFSDNNYRVDATLLSNVGGGSLWSIDPAAKQPGQFDFIDPDGGRDWEIKVTRFMAQD